MQKKKKRKQKGEMGKQKRGRKGKRATPPTSSSPPFVTSLPVATTAPCLTPISLFFTVCVLSFSVIIITCMLYHSPVSVVVAYFSSLSSGCWTKVWSKVMMHSVYSIIGVHHFYILRNSGHSSILYPAITFWRFRFEINNLGVLHLLFVMDRKMIY